MDSNLIVLTDQDGNSVRFELLDIVEYKEDEYAVLYPADSAAMTSRSTFCVSFPRISMSTKPSSKVSMTTN